MVSNATRRCSISTEEGAWGRIPARSQTGPARMAKGLNSARKNEGRFDLAVHPAARTAPASVVDIDRRGLSGLRRGGRAVEGGGLLNRYRV